MFHSMSQSILKFVKQLFSGQWASKISLFLFCGVTLSLYLNDAIKIQYSTVHVYICMYIGNFVSVCFCVCVCAAILVIIPFSCTVTTLSHSSSLLTAWAVFLYVRLMCCICCHNYRQLKLQYMVHNVIQVTTVATPYDTWVSQ